MTDNEIIKAFELCTGDHDVIMCPDCPYKNDEACYLHSVKDALNLINRQQAKIEALQMDKKQLQSDIINANMNLDHIQELWKNEKEKVKTAKQKVIDACKRLKTAKSEAVREFAKKVKQEAAYCSADTDELIIFESTFDRLVEGMEAAQ